MIEDGDDGDVSDDYDEGLKLISDGYCDDDNGDCYYQYCSTIKSDAELLR